jgi:hypothetical protein
MAAQVELYPPPDALRLKIGRALGGLNGDAIARAEAAVLALSSQFGDWLQDELDRLDAAYGEVKALGSGSSELEEFYRRVHDLKGLGTTYGYPIVSQFAGSLCRFLDSDEARAKAPRQILDSHVAAIHASVRQKITTTDHPIGKALLNELAAQVARFAPEDDADR